MSRLILLRSSEPVRLRGLLQRVPGVAPAAALIDASPAGEEPPASPGKTVQIDQGFVIGGEPLIQRSSQDELVAYRSMGNLRTDQLLTAIGTPPPSQGVFRYRQFLFAVIGQLSPVESRAQHTADLPLQLRDNLRGRSEAELFFHQVLSHLHDADPAYLTAGELSPEVSVAVLAKALRQAVPDEQAAGVVAALSHGDQLVVARRGHSTLRYHSLTEGSSPAPLTHLTLAVATVEGESVTAELTPVPEGQALVISPRKSRPTLVSLT